MIQLKAPKLEDAKRVNEAIVQSHGELKRWMPWCQVLPSVAETRANIESVLAQGSRERRFHIFNDADELVGVIGIHALEADAGAFEIGYWLHSAHTGNGYATEAVKRATDYGLENMQAQRLQIICASNNLASQAVALRAGYVLEGESRANVRLPDGEIDSEKMYGCVVEV